MFVIDRFEGDWAIIEFNQKIFNIPKVVLPPGVREGDVITINISIDKETTDKRKRDIKELADELFED